MSCYAVGGAKSPLRNPQKCITRIYDPTDTDEGVALTSLKVTFLLAWGSSTIFCKFAATEKKDKVLSPMKGNKNQCTFRKGGKHGRGLHMIHREFLTFRWLCKQSNVCFTDLLLSPSRPPGLLTLAPGTLHLLCLKSQSIRDKLWQVDKQCI